MDLSRRFFSFLVKLMKSTRASLFDIKVKKCTVYKTKISLCFFACDAYKSEGFSVYTLRTPCLAKIKFPDVGKHIANFTKLAQLQKKSSKGLCTVEANSGSVLWAALRSHSGVTGFDQMTNKFISR